MKRILWIDDDAELIDKSMPLFQEHGFLVLKASNTTEALRLLRENESTLDGVMIDVRLSAGENGLQLLRELEHRYPRLRKVIFTAFPEYDDHVVAEHSGALAYLEKIDKSIPLDPTKQRRFFEALHQVFPANSARSPQPPENAFLPVSAEKSLWIKGSFFLLSLVVVAAVVAVLASVASPWLLPVAIVGSVLLFAIVGAYVLRTQKTGGLGEKNFLSLMAEILRHAPTILKSRPRNDGGAARSSGKGGRKGRKSMG